MKKWNLAKNVMLAAALTTIYAIWAKDELHEVSTAHMWVILILVGVLILHLFVYLDREIRRIHNTRKKKIIKTRRTVEKVTVEPEETEDVC